MYKIYINDHPLYLLKEDEVEKWMGEEAELYPYMGKKKNVLRVIDQLEKSDDIPLTGLYSHDYEGMKKDVKSLFEKVTAAGGVVRNDDGEVLFIFRRKRWDLPKGKKEKNETNKECALREVQEETGLQELQLHSKIGKTRHVYRDPETGERILKITHWYKMSIPFPQELDLQYEEDIETAKWMDVPTFFDGNYITFTNIKDVLTAYQLLDEQIS